MHERLKKYYNGRTCDNGVDTSSALAWFAALLDGDYRNGAIFQLNSDEFMQEYLYPEDFEYWLQKKEEFLAKQ